jgi:hypothetical protein
MVKVYQTQGLTLQWGLDCPRDPALTLRKSDALTTMGYTPAPGEGAAVEKANNVHPPTNCSTCHR